MNSFFASDTPAVPSEALVEAHALAEASRVYTRGDFLADLRAEFDTCYKIVQAKNQDYGAKADPFRNFRGAELVGVPNDQAVLVRMSDKMARIATLLEKAREGQGAAVSDESVEDTLRDLANYALILLLFIRHGDKL